MTKIQDLAPERRKKYRFPMSREMRYKVLEDDAIVDAGTGMTVDMGSGGIAFQPSRLLRPGAFVELSISWPVLLDDACPMRLIVFGRVLRSSVRHTACTVDKYEFRTQGRAAQQVTPIRSDAMLQRWADNIRRELVKTAAG